MRSVVFTGGPGIDSQGVLRALLPDDSIISADSGAMHARELGLTPSELVGDLDSIDAPTLAWIRENDIPVIQFPVAKDMTDSELCLRRLKIEEPILWVCSLTGRPDHVLSNLHLMGRLAEEGYEISATDGVTWVFPMSGCKEIRMRTSDPRIFFPDTKYAVSLIPLSAEVTGVTTTGLGFPLVGATLHRGSSFSVSNEPTKETPVVGIDMTGGTLLYIVTPAV